MRKAISILGVLAVLYSCIEPNEIEVLQVGDPTVYGLWGEGEAPVVFLYAIDDAAVQFIYLTQARITFTPLNGDPAVELVPVRWSPGDPVDLSNEFPFGGDASGQVWYFTTPGHMPLLPDNYEVLIEYGDITAVASLSFPGKREFVSVEHVIRDSVERVRMTLPWPELPGYYKWEILIDQVMNLTLPVAYDSISGDPLAFSDTTFQYYHRMTPKKYLTPAVVAEAEGVFNYKLTGKLPDFPYNQESYLLNVRLRHYSDAVADFFESAGEQQNGTLFDPFAEPIPIRSNVVGMFGVLGTYSYSSGVMLEYLP